MDVITSPQSEPQTCKDPRRSGVKTSAADRESRGRDLPASLVIKGLGLETEHAGSQAGAPLTALVWAQAGARRRRAPGVPTKEVIAGPT